MSEAIFSIADLIWYGLIGLAMYCVYRRGVWNGVQLAFDSMGMEVVQGDPNVVDDDEND